MTTVPSSVDVDILKCRIPPGTIFLQIIYLNGFVLKLFISWIYFFLLQSVSSKDASPVKVTRGATWNVSGSATAGASGHVGDPGTTDRAADPDTTQLGCTLFNIFYILYIFLFNIFLYYFI